MGLFISQLYDAFQEAFVEDDPAKILMLGLDNAGKTTILYKLKLNEVVTSIPTVGFNVETVSPFKGVSFTVWDIGGQGKIRQLWHHYYSSSDGFIYVVDSTDRSRFEEAREELFGVLDSEEMPRRCPLVVIANKQDLPGAATPSEIADALKLRSISNRSWIIQGTSAPEGKGLHEVVSELGRLIKQHKRDEFTLR